MVRAFFVMLMTLCLSISGLALTGMTEAARAQAPEAAKSAPAKKAPATKTAGTKLAPGQKLCKSKQPSGSTKSWTCGQDQPCCVNHSMNLYTCGSQLLKCF